MGQTYVMFSRVTDPHHLELIGRSVCTCVHPVCFEINCNTLQAFLPSTSSMTSSARGLKPASTRSNACAKTPRSHTSGSTPLDVVKSGIGLRRD